LSVFSFKFSRSSLSVGLKRVLIGKGTHFSPTDNELLEHLKEKMDQTNSMSYPFIDAFVPMTMVIRRSFALCFLVLRCVLKLFLSVS
jgi:hypothetical protein